jgi:hypothetical protein
MHATTDFFGDYPESEHVELDRRLSQLEWPSPSPDVKQRGLEAIRFSLQAERAPRREPSKVVRVQRFELTRARTAWRTAGWSAPQRQVRLAVSL